MSLWTQRDYSASSTLPCSKDLPFAYPSLASSESSSLKSMSPPPCCTQTAGRLLGPSRSCATALAIRHQWTCSCTSWRPRVLEEVVGKLQRSCWEGSSNSLSAVIQGLQREVLQGSVQQKGPHSLRQVSPTGQRNLNSRSPGASRTYPHGNERCATSFLAFKRRLTPLSCSNLSLALRPLRVTLVLVYLCFCSYLLVCALQSFQD